MVIRSLSLQTILLVVFVVFVCTACPTVPGDPEPDAKDINRGEELPVEVDVEADETASGDLPCEPQCDDLECGLDPLCGESCGECAEGEECVEGACECAPQCDDLECGLDPLCGESCGECAEGEECVEGVCECVPVETCDDLGLVCGPHPECPEQSCGEDCGEGFHCEDGACVPDQCDDCCLPCDTHSDCADAFTAEELGPCKESLCVYDADCPDLQCEMVPLDDPFCCETEDDCQEPKQCQTVDCIENHCYFNKIPDCCPVDPALLYALDFDDLEVGAEPPPVVMVINDEDTLDSVTWTAQEAPCGDGMALYLGDPACETYFNGELFECAPLNDKDCANDDECPEPSTCNTVDGINKCIGAASTAVAFQAAVPQVDLPADSYVSLFYTLRTDLEPVNEGFVFDTLKLYLEYTPDPDLPPVEVELHVAPQSTDGDCTVFAADLTIFAPVSSGPQTPDTPVKLIWRFDTFDGVSNHFSGLWLDDIQVHTYCNNCVSSTTCDDEDACTDDTCIDPPIFGGEEGLCFHVPVIENCISCEAAEDCEDGAPECYVWECGEVEGYCLYSPDPECCEIPEDPYLLNADLEGGELPVDWEVVVTDAPDVETSDVTWSVTNASACDGSYALYFGNGEDYDCGQASCAGQVTTTEIDLTDVEDVFDLRLSFCANLSTEWDVVEPEDYPEDNAHTVQIDVLYVEVLVGEEVAEVWNSDIFKGTTYGLWEDAWADLSPYKGETVRLRFRFQTGTAEPANNEAAGAFVDNIRLELVCAAVCATAADCTDGGDCAAAVCELGVCSYPVDPVCCTDEINSDCNDDDPCTNDVCDLGDNICEHTFTGDPQCCNPNPSVFADSLLSAENAAWFVPESLPSCGVFPYQCEEEEGEDCVTCPSDCGACEVRWSVISDQSFTAPYSLYFGNPGVGNYENGQDPARGFIAGPDVELPPYGIPAVSFHLWLDTEHTPTWLLFEQQVEFDILRLHVQQKTGEDTYGEMTEIWNSMAWDFKGSTFDPEADDVVWRQVHVAMDELSLEGETVRFVLEFDSADDSNNGYQGAYVDDFKVSTLCDDAFECLSAYDCAETNPADPNCSMELCDGADGPGGESGDCYSEPNTMLEGCCVQEVLGEMGSDFDAPCSMEDWVASPAADQSSVAWQTWDQENNTQGGECALYFGNPDAGNYDIPEETPQGIVTSPTWEIPAGLADEVEVSFWLWMDLEDTWSLTDVLSLHMGLKYYETLPPNEEILLWSKPCDMSVGLCDTFQDYCDAWGCTTWPWAQWKHVTLTLSTAQFAGYSHVNFWFEFNAYDEVNNEGVGIFVDDFEVHSTCAQ